LKIQIFKEKYIKEETEKEIVEELKKLNENLSILRRMNDYREIIYIPYKDTTPVNPYNQPYYITC
jgi:hypothetical protein